jgi:hypothetical protein
MPLPQNYTSPVTQLFDLENPDQIKDWSFYLTLGITLQQLPELSRMAIDRTLIDSVEDETFFAVIHAWRTLAVLETPEAIAPLIQVFQRLRQDEDYWDWFGEELPDVFGRIGLGAMPELARVLADTKYHATVRQNVTEAIAKIYKQYPETRSECIAVLMAQLQRFTKNDPDLNAYLVMFLAVDLKAVEAAPVIEQAYAVNRVNEDFIGDWEDAQVHLGLREKRDRPERSRNILTDPWQYVPPKAIGFGSGQKKKK